MVLKVLYICYIVSIKMDALSTVLEATQLRSIVYNKIAVTAPWGLDVIRDQYSQFWRLIKGICVVGLPDGTTIEMQEGDLVFIPHGSAHWIADSIISLRIPAAEFVKARHAGVPVFKSGTEESIIIGGHFQFEEEYLHPFLKDLPQIIHVTQFETENQVLLKHTSQLIFAELNNERPGSKLMLQCLSKIAFINIIRAYLEQATPESGFLSALNDPQISKSLKLMQELPASDWTLESLADEVGMSRSVFFNRFKKLVGETPLSYLTNWRVRKAKELLTSNTDNINEIALNVGYQSEAAFNRIFKTKTGKTPAAYRRAVIA